MDGVDWVDGMDREVFDVLVRALCHRPKSTQSIKSIQSMKSAIV